MKTDTDSDPGVKPAEITEAQVLAFYTTKNAEIRERQRHLCAGGGFDAASLTLHHYGKPFDVTAWKGATYVSGRGETIAEAEAEFAERMSARLPSPAKLRAEADVLLAEANKIEAAMAFNGEAAK